MYYHRNILLLLLISDILCIFLYNFIISQTYSIIIFIVYFSTSLEFITLKITIYTFTIAYTIVTVHDWQVKWSVLTSSTDEATAQANGFPPNVLKWTPFPNDLAISAKYTTHDISAINMHETHSQDVFQSGFIHLAQH